jgi:hypothetical protein
LKSLLAHLERFVLETLTPIRRLILGKTAGAGSIHGIRRVSPALGDPDPQEIPSRDPALVEREVVDLAVMRFSFDRKGMD